MHLIYGDGRQLPFRDRSIHEEICVNVFGDRDTRDPEALAAELGRVLHETGSLTVVETKSPSIMPIERLRGLLGDAGLIQMNVGHELGNLGGVSAYALPSGKLASGDRNAEDYIAIFIHGSWAQG